MHILLHCIQGVSAIAERMIDAMKASELALPLLILGSGRSGTTWIQDVIADAAQLRPIYEPLHPIAVPAAQGLAYRYLKANDTAPDMQRFMDEVFTGRFHSVWADYRVRGDRLRLGPQGFTDPERLRVFYRTCRHLVSNYRRYRSYQQRAGLVVKCIRANLLLAWLVNHYSPRVLFVVRHPCAVSAAKLKAGVESWAIDGPFQQDMLRRYLQEPAIFARIQQAGLDSMGSGLSEAALHAVLWCIENVEPLHEARRLGCTVVYYEWLAGAGTQAWVPVFESLGLDVRPDPAILRRPSDQAGAEREDGGYSETDQPKWRSWLRPDQIADIGRVLNQFEFHDYSIDVAAPVGHNGCR